MIIVSVFILIILLILIIPTVYAAWTGAPLWFTPYKLIKDVFQDVKLKEGQKIYDLGSGTGRILIIAEKYFGATAWGFELSPIFYFLSKLNLHFNKTKKTKVLLKNFFRQNISDADAVFFFLMPPAIEKLKLKLKSELKPGAIVISFAFPIKNWRPKKVIKTEKAPIYVYEVEP